MNRHPILWSLIAFIVGAIAYSATFVTCLGSDPTSDLGSACNSIGFLLKIPFLYFAPYANSRYLGIDSALLITGLNIISWGAFTSAATLLFLKTKKRKVSGSN